MAYSTLISSPAYNALPTIEDQAPPSQIHLEALGKLFLSHEVNEHLGVSLLHRHFHLPDGFVMAHKGRRCMPLLVLDAPSNLIGSSFFLQNDKFYAFEYEESNAPVTIPPTFAEEMASYLLANGLDEQLALSRIDRNAPKLMEHCEDDILAHVCEPTYDEIPGHEATEWGFDSEGVPFITRGCARTCSGVHKAK